MKALSYTGDSRKTSCSVGGIRGSVDVLIIRSSLEDCESSQRAEAGNEESTPTTASLTFRLCDNDYLVILATYALNTKLFFRTSKKFRVDVWILPFIKNANF